MGLVNTVMVRVKLFPEEGGERGKKSTAEVRISHGFSSWGRERLLPERARTQIRAHIIAFNEP